MSILTLEENKSSPLKTIQSESIISTGSPLCLYQPGDAPEDKFNCSNRSVPGSLFCGPHGGKLTLRENGTLGIIGPGCYRAIATLSGLNHRYVSQVLQGKSNPTSNVLERIAQVVGVEVEWLVSYISRQKNGKKELS